jgi:hypothetical protein
MVVHVTAEGAVVSRGLVPMHPKLVQDSRGKSGGGVGCQRLSMSRLLESRWTIGPGSH